MDPPAKCTSADAGPSLDIRVLEARCLPDHNTFSKPSVYCVVKYNGKELARTAVSLNTTEPLWDTALTIDHVGGDGVPLDSAQLTVDVMERNKVLSDTMLGTYSVSLAGLYEGEVLDKWYVLKGSGASGEIRLRLKPNNFGRRREPAAGDSGFVVGIPMA